MKTKKFNHKEGFIMISIIISILLLCFGVSYLISFQPYIFLLIYIISFLGWVYYVGGST